LGGVQHFKNPPRQMYFHDKSNIKKCIIISKYLN
jgi:hypothetical protein